MDFKLTESKSFYKHCVFSHSLFCWALNSAKVTDFMHVVCEGMSKAKKGPLNMALT